MISEIHLKNWKSYESSVLYIDPISVVIGANASGKSNALDAILFLNRVSVGSMLTSALQGDGVQPPLRGGVEWAARKPNSSFTLSVLVRFDETIDYLYSLECVIKGNKCEIQSENLIRIKFRLDKNEKRKSESGRINLYRTDSCKVDAPTVVARLYNEKQGTPRQLSRSHSVLFQLHGQKLRKEIQDGLAAVINDLRNVFILDPIPSHMRDYSPLSEKLEPDAKNIAGVLAALPEVKKDSIEGILTEYARRLPERDIKRVYAETIGKFRTDAMLYCEEYWGEGGEIQTVDARGMSDGTLRLLAIITALLTRPRGSLLVIEEVDNGLHPSRAKLLLEILKNIGIDNGVDVLVTTHNPALLDAMGNEMVPFMTVANRDLKTGYSILTLLEDIGRLPKLLAQGTIGKLSSEGLIEESINKDQVMDD